MSEFKFFNNGVLFHYHGDDEEIAIPPQVVEIGRNAFYGRNMISVTFGESLKKIGDIAFMGCSRLKSIFLPKSVAHLGVKSFAYCESLESVEIVNKKILIEKGAFYNCPSIKTIKAPLEVINRPATWWCERFDVEVIFPIAIEIFDKDTDLIKYIARDKKKALDILVEAKRTDLLKNLLEKSPKIKHCDIDDLIDYALKYKSVEINVILLEYKNKRYFSKK
jgi:hypothetical protein